MAGPKTSKTATQTAAVKLPRNIQGQNKGGTGNKGMYGGRK